MGSNRKEATMSDLKNCVINEVSEVRIKKEKVKSKKSLIKSEGNLSHIKKKEHTDSHHRESHNEGKPKLNLSLSNGRKLDEERRIITLHNLDEDLYSSEWTLGKVPPVIKKNKAVWLIPLKVSNKITIFKIDTGASVTVIPLSVYESLGLDEMETTDISIFGASGHALDVVGQITTTISRLGSNKSALCNISIIKGLQQSLLGLEEITALNLVSLNLDDKTEEATEAVEKFDKEKSPKNGSKLLVNKTQCWQDEFLSPRLELGGSSYCISPMLWMVGMMDFDSHAYKDGMIKNAAHKRKYKHKRRINNPKASDNSDTIFLTFLLKDMTTGYEPSLTSRQGSNQLTWSRHS